MNTYNLKNINNKNTTYITTLFTLSIMSMMLIPGEVIPVHAEDVVIVAAGDIACDPDDNDFNGGKGTLHDCRQMHISGIVQLINPTAILALGDLQYQNGELEDFNRSYDPSWGRMKDITYPSPGNHEYRTDAKGYFDYFGNSAGDKDEGYYSFNIGDWHIISLNSNCDKVRCDENSDQVQWLRNDLSSNTSTCILAYWHHPRFTSSSFPDNEAYEKTYPDTNKSFKVYYEETQGIYDTFWDTLYEYNADVILAGHIHSYERFLPQDPDEQIDYDTGITQFVVGTGGSDDWMDWDQLKEWYKRDKRMPNSAFFDAEFGVLKLTLHQYSFDWKFITSAFGAYTDSGIASCHKQDPWVYGDTGAIFYDGGNVGIGTSSPTEALDIVGSIHVTGDSVIDANLEVAGNTEFGYFTTANGDSSAVFGQYTTAQSYSSFVIGRYNEIFGTTDSWITTEPLFVIGNGADIVNPNNAVTVLKNGNVGIGTTNPTHILEVSGSAAFGHSTTASGSNSAAFGYDTTAKSYASFVIGRYNEISGTAGKWIETDPLFVIGNGIDASDHNAVTVLKNGNVGIGTSSPTEALDITGNTHVTGDSIIDGNVGIGTDSPNSKLEVTNGYFELDTSSGVPSARDCTNADEVGRMKVDDSTTDLYVCTSSGWVTK